MAHYPWEFSLNDLTISEDATGIIVTAPNSGEIGVSYRFKHVTNQETFLAWFNQHHSDKFRFMHNFIEVRK